MSLYDKIPARSKGAWVVHHAQKTAATINGAAEFPALDAAGKAASLLSQLAATDQIIVERSSVNALGQSAGLNPKIELPALLNILAAQRLISLSTVGDVEVLGLTTSATVQHAATIFEAQEPTTEERAVVALAELSSEQPITVKATTEYLSDEFRLPIATARELLNRSEVVGFIDAEGKADDKLYFNGNIFRRDNLQKTRRVLDSLSTADTVKVNTLNERLGRLGCVGIADADAVLGTALFDKLKAAGMYDINFVANPSGEFGFITRPAAFHKFNDPLVDDAFDLAKALVAALFYGMTQSGSSRGRIDMIGALLRKLTAGYSVGPATAIGEDYRVLETKGVIRVWRGQPYGYMMKLLKKDVGEMALQVLLTGETASTNAMDRPLPGNMTGYSGPEKTRSDFRKRQAPASKKMTSDILQALRTKGGL